MRKNTSDAAGIAALALGWVFITAVFTLAGGALSDMLYEPGEETYLTPTSFAVGAAVGAVWVKFKLKRDRTK